MHGFGPEHDHAQGGVHGKSVLVNDHQHVHVGYRIWVSGWVSGWVIPPKMGQKGVVGIRSKTGHVLITLF